MSTHFVAHLKIEKVEKTAEGPLTQKSEKRVIDEVTQINLKDSDLDKLKAKLNGHISLIEDS